MEINGVTYMVLMQIAKLAKLYKNMVLGFVYLIKSIWKRVIPSTRLIYSIPLENKSMQLKFSQPWVIGMVLMEVIVEHRILWIILDASCHICLEKITEINTIGLFLVRLHFIFYVMAKYTIFELHGNQFDSISLNSTTLDILKYQFCNN